MIHLVGQDTHRGEELPMPSVQQAVYALRSPQVTTLTLTSANTFFSELLKYVENPHQWHHLLRKTPHPALT